ncbi:MAG: hypothetical protein WAW80_01550 [Candidatus Saccharimonadales bacterium]
MKLDALSMPINDKDTITGSSYSDLNILHKIFFRNIATDDWGSFKISPWAASLIIIGFFAVILMFVSGVLILQITAVIFVLITLVIGVIFIMRETKTLLKNQAMEEIRLNALANDNGWTYVRNTKTVNKTGTMFTLGLARQLSNVITAPNFQVGEYNSTYDKSKSERIYKFGYIEIPLKRNIPNMLLDTKNNNMSIFGMELSNLPVKYDKSQVVSLEGDFDKFYTLYAPKGYDADVRYVFTPDLMQLLIAESNSTDVEIVDNTMYLYLGSYDLIQPIFWKRLERILATIGQKIERQTKNYEDDNAPNGGVAVKGRRLLRRRVSIFIIIIVVLDLLFELTRLLGIFNN